MSERAGAEPMKKSFSGRFAMKPLNILSQILDFETSRNEANDDGSSKRRWAVRL